MRREEAKSFNLAPLHDAGLQKLVSVQGCPFLPFHITSSALMCWAASAALPSELLDCNIAVMQEQNQSYRHDSETSGHPSHSAGCGDS